MYDQSQPRSEKLEVPPTNRSTEITGISTGPKPFLIALIENASAQDHPLRFAPIESNGQSDL